MAITHTFSSIRVGDKVTFTVDIYEEGWLQSGEVVDTGASVYSTDEAGISIVSQNWSDSNHKNNVYVSGIAGRVNPYLLLLRLKTNLRDVNKEIYIPVKNAGG